MAELDWGLDAELQEKCLVGEQKLSTDPIPPPVVQNEYSPPPVPQHESASRKEEEPELNVAEISFLNKLVRTHLVEVKHDVDIQRNPDSPLYSVKSFEELNLRPELLKGVFAMGYNSPSKIQETALPTLIADPPQNMIAQSQSGTGKTAAFILASLSRVDTNLKYPHILVLSPTYELAIQVGNVAEQMAKFCPNIEFCYAVRGEQLSRGSKITAQFMIGTPGKVYDWAMRFKFFELRKMKVFVLDEADVMISTQGYHDQSLRIHKQLPETCQMMLFSATYSEDVMQFAEQIVPDPIIIKLKREEETIDTIAQYYIVCKNREEKFEALSNIYGTISIGQAIIFCDTKKNASYLVEKMAREGHAVALLSGDLTVEQRIAVLNRFREGKEKVLITTNVVARGIDIEQVTVVVNFDLPTNQNYQADFETYLHRIGRTGRFGKTGLAISFVDGKKAMSVLLDIEEHFGKKITKIDANEIEDLEQMGRN